MSAVTQKGQVTVPKPMRDYLGLQTGDRVRFELAEDGRVYLAPEKPAPPSRFARASGMLRFNMTADELMEMSRGEG